MTQGDLDGEHARRAAAGMRAGGEAGGEAGDRARTLPASRGPVRSGVAVRQTSLRSHNLAVVLRHVLDARHPVSRADVASATGLTRATVSALVDQLVAGDLIAEQPPVVSRRVGRPAVPLVPARGTIAAVGMEVNVDYLGVRAADIGGRTLQQRVVTGDLRGSDAAAVLGRLADLACGVVTELRRDGVRVIGSGLALPGLVDTVVGPLRVAPNLGWREVDVLAALTAYPELADLHPRLGNEANLAAIAEAAARRSCGPSSFIYVSGEIGIGGAIVLDGQVFPGRHGWSGEIGHAVLGVPGSSEPAMTLEAYAGQDALLRGAGLPMSAPFSALVAAVAAGDRRAVVTAERAGDALGIVLSAVVSTVDVTHIVLGGIYADLIDHLAPAVMRWVRDHVISTPWAPVELSAAVAGQYPAMTGAALDVMNLVVQEPEAWIRQSPAQDG